MLILRDEYNVLCLGLSGSGKSTLLAHLVGESTSNIEPTIGFNIKTLPIKETVVCIKEVGGSCRIRLFWDNYFHDKNAILFAVNAASSDDELSSARETLRSVLSNSRLKGHPCMILGTHMDLPGAKSEQDLEQYFQSVMYGHKWKVKCCSSYDREQILDAFEKLLDLIVMNVH